MTAQLDIASDRLRRTIRPHLDLLSNSGSLMATSAVTSVLGFVFWWVAARGASETVVGQASAAVSAMTFIGTIGVFGLGTLLISELPAMRRDRWRLISACVVVSVVIGVLGGLIYVVVARVIGGPGAAVGWSLGGAVVVVGIAITVGTLVLDDAVVGMLAGGVQLVRNAYFSAGKLLFLGLCALAPIALTATEIVGAWVLAAMLSVLAVAASVRARGLGGSLRPDFSRLRSMRKPAFDHNLLNLSLYLPRLALPLVVTVVISAQATAGFYTAWMIVTVLAMIPNHLATVLFAVAAKDLDALRAKVRMSLMVALALGVPLSLAVAVERDRVMAIFGPGYVALGANVLGILSLTYVATVVRSLYIAISRVLGHVRRASAVALCAGAAELAAAVAGGLFGGLTGLSLALAAVFVAEALVMAPTVLRVAGPIRSTSRPLSDT